MTTKTKDVKVKKVMKKVTKSVNAKRPAKMELTLNQANSLKNALAKNNKSFKFLDAKIDALNA